MLNGSDGVALTGKAEEYATEMWLDDPSAFWLHPEGPLSDTTPDEYRVKLAEQERQRREAMAQNPLAGLAQMGLARSAYASQLMNASQYYASLPYHNALRQRLDTGLGALLGGLV